MLMKIWIIFMLNQIIKITLKKDMEAAIVSNNYFILILLHLPKFNTRCYKKIYLILIRYGFIFDEFEDR